MSEPYPDNDFLLRWLNGGLTEAERLEWEASEAYPRWEAMARSLKASALPPLDKDAAYARLLDARARRLQGSIRRLRVWRLAAAAAVVALILIGVGLYPREQSWAAAMAEQRSISLPDGSEAILNAATTLSYRNGWLRNSRKVKLDGEAFFSVTPGVPFTVRTGIGEVRVLGTQFNVLARGSRFEVACMEGSVLVRYGTQQDTLKPGQSLKKQGAQLEQQPVAKSLERPPWTHGV
ncbi:MAG: FecR domain-containing protein, partial [Phaeodactylibacter sp.]|nr:FecR domain-containing protein [Phaeodactylibacter sp.]